MVGTVLAPCPLRWHCPWHCARSSASGTPALCRRRRRIAAAMPLAGPQALAQECHGSVSGNSLPLAVHDSNLKAGLCQCQWQTRRPGFCFRMRNHLDAFIPVFPGQAELGHGTAVRKKKGEEKGSKQPVALETANLIITERACQCGGLSNNASTASGTCQCH